MELVRILWDWRWSALSCSALKVADRLLAAEHWSLRMHDSDSLAAFLLCTLYIITQGSLGLSSISQRIKGQAAAKPIGCSQKKLVS
jgi:hypothetical protein